ncbi:Uncharacterised protein [Bordetella pertussis]|nr:Uncharacterised protein [Bordetella pertussis]
MKTRHSSFWPSQYSGARQFCWQAWSQPSDSQSSGRR